MSESLPVTAGDHHIVILEANECRRTVLASGAEVGIGRHGDLMLGAVPEDLCVSRQALRVGALTGAWHVEVSNAAGAWVQPWMAARRRVPQGHRERFDRSRICIDVTGSDHVRHRVLLERDDHDDPTDGVTRILTKDAGRGGVTAQVRDPRDLTLKQLSVLTAVFGEFLTWPPAENPRVTKFRTAGKGLGISDSGIKDHLTRMQARLNTHSIGHASLDDPRWVYALVDLGLLVFPGVLPPRVAHVRTEVDLRDDSTSDRT